MSQVWPVGAVLHKKDKWDPEVFCSIYERPVKTSALFMKDKLLIFPFLQYCCRRGYIKLKLICGNCDQLAGSIREFLESFKIK